MKKRSFLKLVIVFLVMVYLLLYTAKNTSLIEIQNRKDIELTNREIYEFEEKIEQGEALDLDKYITKKKDYTNFFSKLGLTFSNVVSFIINDGIKEVFTFILKIFS